MTTHNANNERIKRKYFTYLKEAMRYSEASVDGVAKALSRFEEATKYRDFKAFHFEQAVAFKRRLADQVNPKTGRKLSKATLNGALAYLKRFFHWLAGQPGYKSRLQYSDADYFNLSEKDVRIATARRETIGPTLDQVKHVISLMPVDTPIQRRDRALIAFTILTGARDSAIASMKMKHVDPMAACVEQDAREVQTKFSKTFTTYFFPVGDEIREIVADWIEYLRGEMLWGNDDPLFPATQVGLGETKQFEAIGLQRVHWSNASRIRTIFREAFTNADLPYFNPHSFRNTLVRLGQSLCRTPEEFKAWSQNLGHDKVLTTFINYGQVESSRQGNIIRELADPQPLMNPNIDELAKALAREMGGTGSKLPGE